MEPSKTQQHITSLGEQLVNSLGKAFDVGPVARWMAHYIAEQMMLAEKATGETRLAAQQRCFDTILKLWSQRATIPGSGRPFRNFQPILDVLERLDLKTPSFYHTRSGWSSDENADGEVAQIVQMVTSIDETARALIRTFLSIAVARCEDEATLGYLKAIQEDMQSTDTRIVFNILSEFDSDEDLTAEQTDNNKKHIEALDRFVVLALKVRKLLTGGVVRKKGTKSKGKRKSASAAK